MIRPLHQGKQPPQLDAGKLPIQECCILFMHPTKQGRLANHKGIRRAYNKEAKLNATGNTHDHKFHTGADSLPQIQCPIISPSSETGHLLNRDPEAIKSMIPETDNRIAPVQLNVFKTCNFNPIANQKSSL